MINNTKPSPAANPGRKKDIMKKFENGQRFWDEKNGTEIEIMKI